MRSNRENVATSDIKKKTKGNRKLVKTMRIKITDEETSSTRN